jgi:riboflavin synthase
MHYVVEKGFIAIDGASLTITDKYSDSFQVSIVEFTRQHSTFGERQVGDTVNLEVDIIAKYVEQFSRPENKGVTADFLAEHGFLTR